MSTINEKFGSRVTSAWNDLRPQTRTLLERAWQSVPPAPVEPRAYDPRADRELSKLLAALDERTQRKEAGAEDDSTRQARRLADTCVQMLTQQTQSAEVFGQLIQRAHERQQFARLDELADGMALRLAPSELCDMARSQNVVVRALANEVLTQAPPSLLRALLHDPIDADVARSVLERQAHEFGLEEAKRTLREIDEFGG
ncbi:MAG: hypothetical protein ACT4OT_03180 [Acidobacteriota bacterium]